MLLLAAATELEVNPLADLLRQRNDAEFLLSGVGLVETALSLARFLESPKGRRISGVINYGVAGAFADSGAKLLDICLAREDCLADLGICHDNRIEKFDSLAVQTCFNADPRMFSAAVNGLSDFTTSCRKGPFITVNAVSGTAERADFFWQQYKPLCESMEGAAVMRVCQDFNLPCLEIRAVSNFVEKRNRAAWNLEGAALRCAEAVAHILPYLQ